MKSFVGLAEKFMTTVWERASPKGVLQPVQEAKVTRRP